MLEKIRARNYKAFDDATVPIKPITILLGANSVGKSSIIQLLLLLQQTAKEDFKSYKSALKLYGGTVNLGDGKNLFRKHITENPLKISFSIIDEDFGRYLTSLKNNLLDSLLEITRYFPIGGFSDLRKERKDIDNDVKFKIFFAKIVETIKGRYVANEYLPSFYYMLARHGSSISTEDFKSTDKMTRIYSVLDKIARSVLIGKEFDFIFRLGYVKNKLVVESFRIEHEQKVLNKTEKKVIIGFRSTKKTTYEKHIFSDYISFTTNESNEILNYFDKNNTLFDCFISNQERKESDSTIISYMANILIEALKCLRKAFSETSINYVSPLRAHPKRYYMLDKAKTNITLDTLDGDDIADVLKNDTKVTKSVNNWLEKFNLKINVEAFKEVVHHLRVKQNNLNLDITDVGFGISQVLPVIIQGFLSKSNSITIIEQPEIHLHPKMQADLTDLFIDIVKLRGKKKLIIETHSEYILKRLRRRISEGVISSDDVSICLFHPQTNDIGAKIEALPIEKKGWFKYPIDFYGEELEKDIIEFLKNQ